jgi:hypothetical protein
VAGHHPAKHCFDRLEVVKSFAWIATCLGECLPLC